MDYVLSVLRDNNVIHYQIFRHGEDAFFSVEEQTVIHGLETLVEYYQGDGANGSVCQLRSFVEKDPLPHDTRRHGITNLLHRATKEGKISFHNGTPIFSFKQCCTKCSIAIVQVESKNLQEQK